MSRRRAADSAVARQGEGNNDTNDLEMELLYALKMAALGLQKAIQNLTAVFIDLKHIADQKMNAVIVSYQQ